MTDDAKADLSKKRVPGIGIGKRMKYLTAQWYENCQMIGYYYRLNISKKAEAFSEECFQERYRQRLQEAREWYRSYAEEEKLVYQEEEVADDLQASFQRELEKAKRELPAEILAQVADLRMLALNTVTAEVYLMIREYCKRLAACTDSRLRAYNAYFKKMKSNLPKDLQELNLHDCVITGAGQYENDFWLAFDVKDKFCPIDQMIFKNVRTTRACDRLLGATWLYDEIYPEQKGLALHWLAGSKDWKELMEPIVVCDEVELVKR